MRSCCLLLVQLFVLVNSYQDGISITTPGFPKPYRGQLTQQRKYITVNSTQGVAVVFEQFLASAHDCFIACQTDGVGCSSLCGDAMDHGLMPKLLRVPGNATLTMVSIDQADGYRHSGISAKVLTYDLQKLSFFDCNDEIDLSSGETYYLISQNYPSTPTTSSSNCSIKFSTSGTRQGIRFAVYDFYMNQPDSFEITGTNGDHAEITGFATEDEPVAFYFEQQANVNFSIAAANHSFVQKRFYILVKSYEVPPNKTGDTFCEYLKNWNLHVDTWMVFALPNYTAAEYDNNILCAFNMTRTRQKEDSMFALSLEYESEKCCDTMSINGLFDGSPEWIYQGYQYPQLFFTYSYHISFLFESDPVFGAAGFLGRIEHMSCDCMPSEILAENGTLTTPGYYGPSDFRRSVAYCPKMNCNPLVMFQADLYDLQLVFTDINLRTYYETNETDYTGLVDAYGHQLVYAPPNYAGPTTFWATESPVTVQFVTRWISALPLSANGRGFSIDLNLIKKNYVKKQVNFDDGYFFEDISNLDLNSGNTFEFQVNGRKGKQIYVYFFTKTTNQVFVDIYDGDSMNDILIDNKVLYSNVNENGPSIMLSTSIEKAVIHIRGNPTYLANGQDFQAMITDVKLGRNCEPMVYSLKGQKSIGDIHLGGDGCDFKILHFSDGSYSQSAFMNVQFSKCIDMQVFLGLTTSSDKLIAQSANDTLPQDIFTNYLVIKYSTSDIVTVSYSWDISSGIVARTMQPDENVILMSDDYGKTNSTPVTQQFSVQLEGESNVQTGLTIEFLTNSGLGTGTLTWSSYNSEITKESFSSESPNNSPIYSSCGNKLLVDYTSPGGSHNGLHAKITRANLRCSSAAGTSIFVILLVVSSLFILY